MSPNPFQSSGREWYTPAPQRARPADKCAARGRRRQIDTKCHHSLYWCDADRSRSRACSDMPGFAKFARVTEMLVVPDDNCGVVPRMSGASGSPVTPIFLAGIDNLASRAVPGDHMPAGSVHRSSGNPPSPSFSADGDKMMTFGPDTKSYDYSCIYNGPAARPPVCKSHFNKTT